MDITRNVRREPHSCEIVLGLWFVVQSEAASGAATFGHDYGLLGPRVLVEGLDEGRPVPNLLEGGFGRGGKRSQRRRCMVGPRDDGSLEDGSVCGRWEEVNE